MGGPAMIVRSSIFMGLSHDWVIVVADLAAIKFDVACVLVYYVVN